MHLKAVPGRALRALVTALVLVLAATTAPAQAGASDGKPTVVLVHGAWADASSWAPVARRLQRAGYTVLAPPNPLRGLGADVEYVKAFLGTVEGPVVAVGHSYGGMVITGAAAENPNVRALVYVNAFIPDEGDTLEHLVGKAPGSAVAHDPASVFNFAPIPGAPEGVVDLYLKRHVVMQSLAQDLPRRVAAVIAATQRPLAVNALQEPAGAPAWKSAPAFAVVGRTDRIIPPAGQLSMARHADAQITQVEASHLSLVSRPDAVARVIKRAANGEG